MTMVVAIAAVVMLLALTVYAALHPSPLFSILTPADRV